MKNLFLVLIANSLLCSLMPAGTPSDPAFGGVWTLDRDRSFSNPAGLEQTMTISFDGTVLKIDARLKTAQAGDQTVQESWTLDGEEREFSPSGAAPGTKAKGKASWLPGRRGILITDERTITTQKGSTTQQTTRKLTLSPEGTVLTVDYYFDTPRGQYEAKRVFQRKSD